MKNRKPAAWMLTVAALAGIGLGGCGNTIDNEAVFATLDDTVITMGVANFSAKYQQVTYDWYFLPYYGEDMWSSDLYGNGNTLEQDVKTDVAETLEDMYLLKAHMADYGVELTQEEDAAIASAADAFLADNSKDAISQIGAENREDVIEMLRLYTIQSKMRSSIMEEADAEVTDEEAAQRSFSYVSISTNGYYDSDYNYIEYTEEELADLKQQAEDIAAAEDFEAAVTDAGYTVYTESYGSVEDTDASLSTEILEAADKLSEGEVSGVIETDSGYYVVRLDSEFDEEATAAKKEEMITQKQEDHYEDVLSGWRDEAVWEINEEEWAKVTFEDHFSQKADTEAASEEDTDNVESISDTEAE